MFPSFLITIREVIEASLIVATVLGILVKLDRREEIKTVWLGAGGAAFVSAVLLALGSLLGIKVQELYAGRIEEITEGTLMAVSALFITWAVFFLHTYFAQYKVRLLKKVKTVVEQRKKHGLFFLVFTAVLREGSEIVLFLTTIYFSSQPAPILSGFMLGLAGGLVVSFAFFWGTVKLPVYWAFRFSSIMLILFAAGLLARGAQEFIDAGFLPEIGGITLGFLPQASTFVGEMTNTVFGLTRAMDLLPLSLYTIYIWVMHWWVFVRGIKRDEQPSSLPLSTRR